LLLVDDHPIFLSGLANLLTGRGIEVAGTASDGFEALAQARALRPDLVLMDIEMPRCNGLAATRLIKAEMPDVRIVMLSASSDNEDLFAAIRAGASGYLLKTQDTASFIGSLTELSRGEVALAPGMAHRVMAEFARLVQPGSDGNTDLNPLTPRQTQILTLVCQGLSYREIGSQLNLAERTVKYHMGEIVNELHLRNRREAIAYARAHGLDPRR
jgi:two-component system NarL family response regulator